MSYLFQVHGLFDDTDQIHLDYSWTKRTPVDEPGLADSVLLPVPPSPIRIIRPAWFAPVTSALALSLGVPRPKRYCSGERFAVASTRRWPGCSPSSRRTPSTGLGDGALDGRGRS